jgi:hypothetical protein
LSSTLVDSSFGLRSTSLWCYIVEKIFVIEDIFNIVGFVRVMLVIHIGNGELDLDTWIYGQQ